MVVPSLKIMATLVDNKKKRAIKRQLYTKKLNKCEAHIDDGNRELSNALVTDLKSCWKELVSAHEDVLFLLSEADIEKDVYLDDIETNYDQILLKSPNIDTKSDSSSKDTYKIPKVDLKKFNGNLLEWLPFIQGFTNSVHNKKSIPDNVKITILQQHVKGKALETIKYYALTDENYQPALDTLTEKYGDPDKLIDAHIELLLNLRDKVDSITLRSLYDQLFSIVNILETLKINREQYAILLVPMLKCLFPKLVRVEWAKYETEEKQKHKKASQTAKAAKQTLPIPTNRLSLLLEFLKYQVSIAEAAEPSLLDQTKDVKKDKKESPTESVPKDSDKSDTLVGTGVFSVQTGPGDSGHYSGRGGRYPPRGRGRGHNPFKGQYSNSNQGQGQYSNQGQRYPGQGQYSYQGQGRGRYNSSTRPPPNLACPFCSTNHHPDSCKAKNSFSPTAAANLILSSNRCLRCLGPHATELCRVTKSCAICGSDHHPLLCIQRPNLQNVSANMMATTSVQESKSSNQIKSNSNSDFTILHQTATVFASLPSSLCLHPTLVRCLLDSGSQRTYITTDLVQKLGLSICRYEFITSLSFGGAEPPPPKDTPVAKLILKSRHSDFEIEIEALCVEKISAGSFQTLTEEIVNFPHLHYLQLADVMKPNPCADVLIGLDYYWSIIGSEIIRGKVDQPVGIESGFGVVLSGPAIRESIISPAFLTTVIDSDIKSNDDAPSQENRDLLDRFFEIESIPAEKGISEEMKSLDDLAMHSFMDTIQYDGERYSVGLPWRPDHPPLICNEPEAYDRLGKLYRKLDKNPELFSHYENALDEFESSMYVELVVQQDGQYVYYMPHRPAIKTSSTTYKVRPVFDAGAVGSNQVSLNDCLLPGPSLLPDLFDVQLRWRQYHYAVIGDIRRAFLQIGIILTDRDVLRYLRQDKVLRFCRVPFGVNSSPFLLNAVIRYHLQRQKGLFPEEILEDMGLNFYVDDYVSGSESVDRVISQISMATQIMKSAGMEIREWNSNCKLALSHISKTLNINIDNSKITSVLGTQWNTENDNFSLKPVDTNIQQFTKQTVLSVISRVYDVLGHFSPITVRGKILMKKIHVSCQAWNDIIHDPEILLEAQVLFADLRALSSISISRQYLNDSSVPTSLHLFCDASPDAVCAVVFITSNSTANFVTAKTKVSPVKAKVTIPRLELQACFEGSKLIARVVKATPMFRNLPIHCWTDSMVALGWLLCKNVTTLKEIFIYNRVKKIQSLTTDYSWHYIQGTQNPADLATRSNVTLDYLKQCELWWKGPPWLISEKSWPKTPSPIKLSQSSEKDENDAETEITTLLNNTESPKSVLDNTRGRFTPALRANAYALRWLYRFREPLPVSDKMLYVPSFKTSIPTPSSDEMDRAQKVWIKSIQMIHYQKEIHNLKMGRPIPTKSPLNEFRPILDADGVLRSLGRTQRSEILGVPPIILPPNPEQFTVLMIHQTHEKLYHAGVTSTLSQLRQNFIIIRGRRLVRSVLNRCKVCRRHKVLPYLTEPSALPIWRIESDMPFSKIGIDHAGPFSVKGGTASVLIITCCVTRAVHFEVVPDQTSVNVIHALRRSSSRRGPIKMIVSDNAKCFQKAKLSLHGVKWIMIPERSPWWGGFYERQVQNLKRSMKRGIGRAILSYEELRTIVTEIEMVVNLRPITYLSESSDDPLPLRPIDFLVTHGRPLDSETLTEHELLETKFKNRLSILKNVWKRFQDEYLASLHQWKNYQPGGFDPKVGDVVLLQSQGFVTNRSFFPLARIVELITGTDGKVRAAYVLCKGKRYRRSTTHLYPLEISNFMDYTENGAKSDENVVDSQENDFPEDEVVDNDDNEQSDIEVTTRSGRKSRKPVRFQSP